MYTSPVLKYTDIKVVTHVWLTGAGTCLEPEPAAHGGAELAGHEQEDLRLHPTELP